jgi:transcriptional regulator with XRE-family HTH domain
MSARKERAHYLVGLGDRVRDLRRAKLDEKGRWMTQEKLGEKAGLHRTYVSSLEQGTRNPSFRVLLQVAKGLEVDVGELTQGFSLDA